MIGGQHLIADDRWIVLEMKERIMRASEMEIEKKKRLGDHVRHKEVLPILDHLKHELHGNVDRLKGGNLKVLLKWKGVPALKMGNMGA